MKNPIGAYLRAAACGVLALLAPTDRAAAQQLTKVRVGDTVSFSHLGMY